MILKAFDGMPAIYWDINLLIGAFSTFTFFFMAVHVFRRLKHDGVHLTAKGFLLFLLGLGLLQGVLTVQANYTDNFTGFDLLQFELILGRSAIYFFITGMTCFVVLAEIDKRRHSRRTDSKHYRYPLSLLLILLTAVLVSIQIPSHVDVLIYVVLAYTIPIFLYFTMVFVKQFSGLRSVSAKRPHLWILGGILCALLGLVLYNNWIWDFDNPVIPYLNSGIMLVAAILMSHGWELLPSLSELDWLSSLELLIVVHHTGSIPIFDFPFHKPNKADQVKDEFRDSYGTMMTHIDFLIGEILSSKGHIKEISHDKKTIAFTSGKYCTFILIVSNHFEETRFRLERFAIDFEKEFTKKLAGSYNLDINEYDPAKNLISRDFS